MAKGSSFERDICRLLSGWWTSGRRDDVFWRTSNSGGRATVRGKTGLETHGQYGDVCATHPCGRPFLRVLVPEIKRGYSRHTLYDLFDASKNAVPLWASWIAQARKSQTAAGAASWAVIHKRDRRETVIAYPNRFFRMLNARGQQTLINRGMMSVSGNLPVFASRLSDFLDAVEPDDIRRIDKERRKK